MLSGVVEPLGAGLTILAAGLVLPALPYLLGFAAGAMLYVVVEELIPEMSQGVALQCGGPVLCSGLHPDDGAGRGAELKQDGMPALLSGTPGVSQSFLISVS
mgnify:CR=1 FL=1